MDKYKQVIKKKTNVTVSFDDVKGYIQHLHRPIFR